MASLVDTLFVDAQTMRVVRAHETMPDTWWCEGVDEQVGLYAYSSNWILTHLQIVKKYGKAKRKNRRR